MEGGENLSQKAAPRADTTNDRKKQAVSSKLAGGFGEKTNYNLKTSAKNWWKNL